MKRKAITCIKILTWVVVIHGLLCVTMSYIMAWAGIADTLENLSSTLVSEVIAPLTIYGSTKTIENIFQKNRLSFSEPVEEDPDA